MYCFLPRKRVLVCFSVTKKTEKGKKTYPNFCHYHLIFGSRENFPSHVTCQGLILFIITHPVLLFLPTFIMKSPCSSFYVYIIFRSSLKKIEINIWKKNSAASQNCNYNYTSFKSNPPKNIPEKNNDRKDNV